MSFADLLRQYFAADYEECWERERTATPVRASPSGSMRQDFRFGKQQRFSGLSASNARFKRFTNGYIESLTTAAIRRQRS